MIAILHLITYFSEKNIINLNNLTNIYNNNIKLTNKYGNLINPNYKIIQNNDVIYIEDLLNPTFFNHLYNLVYNISLKTRNVYFRKGSGINFNAMNNDSKYLDLLSLYYSDEIKHLLNKLFNKYINNVTNSDKNACSLLVYNNKNDYINWHYDESNLYGNRYTILLTLVNKNLETNGLSSSEFNYQIGNTTTYKIKTKENSLIIFNGSKIYHKATPIENNEKRILLSMVYCDVCQQKTSLINCIYERIKNSILYNSLF